MLEFVHEHGCPVFVNPERVGCVIDAGDDYDNRRRSMIVCDGYAVCVLSTPQDAAERIATFARANVHPKACQT